MSLHVYSANCSWHGSIYETKTTGPGIPCCPHCGSVLFQVEEEEWNAGALKHQEAGHDNYVEMLAWANRQAKCLRSLRDAAIAFEAETGKAVKFD